MAMWFACVCLCGQDGRRRWFRGKQMNRLFHELQAHAFTRHDAYAALERGFDRHHKRLADANAVFDAIASILDFLDDACQ